MEKMPESSARDDATNDSFRHAVDAEIEVLLHLWEDDARADNPHARYGGAPSRKRLRLLLESSPTMLRQVLVMMDPGLDQYMAIIVRNLKVPGIEQTLAMAFSADISLAERARSVLGRMLATGVGQPHNDSAHHLPLRFTASLVIDGILRRARPDAEKVALLMELLPGCDDDSSLALLSSVVLCFPELAYPVLWQRWWAQGWQRDAPASVYLATLARTGTRLLSDLLPELRSDSPQHLSQALAGVRAVANLIGRSVLTRERGPNPSLERRTGGGLLAEEIAPETQQAICAHLADLLGHEDAAVRDTAVATLGAMGGSDQVVALRPCLQHQRLSTRLAATVALQEIGDVASAPQLMELVTDHELPARRAAINALGVLKILAAEDMLIQLVEDEQVRPQAITALGELGGDGAQRVLKRLMQEADKKVARMASRALLGGKRTPRPVSDTTRNRLSKVRGRDARPLLHISVVGAIRNLPEVRAYTEPEITRLIGEVCGDYATTRRHLVMGRPGLMTRDGGVYQFSGSGKAIWRVERFIRDRYLGAGM
jgi:hypothetical protein